MNLTLSMAPRASTVNHFQIFRTMRVQKPYETKNFLNLKGFAPKIKGIKNDIH